MNEHKKKIYIRILKCPLEGCSVQIGWQEHIEAYCTKHHYKLVEAEEERI